MDVSIFLAKFIGLYLVIVSLGLLVDKKNVDLLFGIYKNKGVVLVTGVLEVGLGLALVLTHNIWEWNWVGVITVIGWMLLARGIGRVAFSGTVVEYLLVMEKKLRKNNTWTFILLFLVFAIGLWLTYIGFTQ